MARVCTICNHEKQDEINQDIINGVSLRNIAKQYNVNYSAVNRHKGHLPAHLAQAKEAEEVSQADDLLAQVRQLQSRTQAILTRAEKAGDLKTALYGVAQARGNTELLCKMITYLEDQQRRDKPRGLTPEVERMVTDPDYIRAMQEVKHKYQAIKAGKDHSCASDCASACTCQKTIEGNELNELKKHKTRAGKNGS